MIGQRELLEWTCPIALNCLVAVRVEKPEEKKGFSEEDLFL